ncbi:hypothetical protein V9T40_008608 [Parthenolecanium corni]|uniref:Uncharacterized protein n=1 Tax=Parthenolecanium corni TaxID=536013 RepID=A0AAN9TNV4_9HEMI
MATKDSAAEDQMSSRDDDESGDHDDLKAGSSLNGASQRPLFLQLAYSERGVDVSVDRAFVCDANDGEMRGIYIRLSHPSPTPNHGVGELPCQIRPEKFSTFIPSVRRLLHAVAFSRLISSTPRLPAPCATTSALIFIVWLLDVFTKIFIYAVFKNTPYFLLGAALQYAIFVYVMYVYVHTGRRVNYVGWWMDENATAAGTLRHSWVPAARRNVRGDENCAGLCWAAKAESRSRWPLTCGDSRVADRRVRDCENVRSIGAPTSV